MGYISSNPRVKSCELDKYFGLTFESVDYSVVYIYIHIAIQYNYFKTIAFTCAIIFRGRI
jgi:hypothetical protein